MDALTVDADGVVRHVQALNVGNVATGRVEPIEMGAIKVPENEPLVERDADGQLSAEQGHT